MSVREIVETPARKLVAGAELAGGPRDGQTVWAIVRQDGRMVVIFRDGSQYTADPAEPVRWMHPAGRKMRAW